MTTWSLVWSNWWMWWKKWAKSMPMPSFPSNWLWYHIENVFGLWAFQFWYWKIDHPYKMWQRKRFLAERRKK